MLYFIFWISLEDKIANAYVWKEIECACANAPLYTFKFRFAVLWLGANNMQYYISSFIHTPPNLLILFFSPIFVSFPDFLFFVLVLVCLVRLCLLYFLRYLGTAHGRTIWRGGDTDNTTGVDMFGFPTATLLDCHGRYAQNVAFFSEWVGCLLAFPQLTIFSQPVFIPDRPTEEAEETFIW